MISGSFGKKVYMDVGRGGQSGHINIISFGDQCNRLTGNINRMYLQIFGSSFLNMPVNLETMFYLFKRVLRRKKL